MVDYDIVIVGSGINSLVAGALLNRKGHKVCILERNDWLGGCIKTAGSLYPATITRRPLVDTLPKN